MMLCTIVLLLSSWKVKEIEPLEQRLTYISCNKTIAQYMITIRKYTRLTKDYRIEYGPFSALFSESSLKATMVKNVSGGGVLFGAYEELPVGSKIILSIYVTGWRQEDGTHVPVPDHAAELQLKAIAEIVRVEHDKDFGYYRTGARFVGRVH